MKKDTRNPLFMGEALERSSRGRKVLRAEEKGEGGKRKFDFRRETELRVNGQEVRLEGPVNASEEMLLGSQI